MPNPDGQLPPGEPDESDELPEREERTSVVSLAELERLANEKLRDPVAAAPPPPPAAPPPAPQLPVGKRETSMRTALPDPDATPAPAPLPKKETSVRSAQLPVPAPVPKKETSVRSAQLPVPPPATPNPPAKTAMFGMPSAPATPNPPAKTAMFGMPSPAAAPTPPRRMTTSIEVSEADFVETTDSGFDAPPARATPPPPPRPTGEVQAANPAPITQGVPAYVPSEQAPVDPEDVPTNQLPMDILAAARASEAPPVEEPTNPTDPLPAGRDSEKTPPPDEELHAGERSSEVTNPIDPKPVVPADELSGPTTFVPGGMPLPDQESVETVERAEVTRVGALPTAPPGRAQAAEKPPPPVDYDPEEIPTGVLSTQALLEGRVPAGEDDGVQGLSPVPTKRRGGQYSRRPKLHEDMGVEDSDLSRIVRLEAVQNASNDTKRFGYQIVIGLLMLVVGVGAFLGFFLHRGDRPTEETLELLYPFGFSGGHLPNGRAAPAAAEVQYEYEGTVDCGDEVCFQYDAHSADDSFHYPMVVKKTGSRWVLRADNGR